MADTNEDFYPSEDSQQQEEQQEHQVRQKPIIYQWLNQKIIYL